MHLLRLPLAAALSVLATAAIAHPGHVDEVAGHTHWLSWGAGGAALLLAAGAGLFAWRAASRRNR